MSGRSGGDDPIMPTSPVSDEATGSAFRYRLVVRSTDGEQTELDARRLFAQPWTERRYEYRCASGERWGGRWRGLPVARLLDLAPVGMDATHLLIESEDATACVPVATALEGIIAFSRDGRRLSLGSTGPRFLAPGIESIRTIKGVERITGTRLESGEDRTERECLPAIE